MSRTTSPSPGCVAPPPPAGWKSVHAFLTTVYHRETAEFRLGFARWLAGSCGHPSVRAAFDAAPRRLVAARRRTPASAEKIYSRHHAQLVGLLAGLPVWSQVAALNRRLHDLRGQGLVPPGIPDASYEGIEEWYFSPQPDGRLREFMQARRNPGRLRRFLRRHPHFQAHQELATSLTFREELGDDAARRFARPEIPDEALWLSALGHELHCLPPLDRKPVIERLAGLLAPVRRLRLAQDLRGALRLHLGALLPAPDGDFAQRRRLAAAWRQQPGLAGLRPLRRAVLRHPRLLDAVRQFYFPGLGWDELRCNRGLVARLLRGSFETDTRVLLDFLFLDRRGRPRGLVPRWMRRATRSTRTRTTARFLRLDLLICHAWPELCEGHRAGRKEAELARLIAPRLDLPEPSRSGAKFLDAFARHRQRLGFLYPLPA